MQPPPYKNTDTQVALATEDPEVVKALPVSVQEQCGHPRELRCIRCSYKWISKLIRDPSACPKCGDRRWNQQRVYTKIYAVDDRRNFRAVPGKRVSHTIGALTAKLDLYRMSKERDIARLAIKKVNTLVQSGDTEKATELIVKLDYHLDWNSSKYPPDPAKWDDLIEQTENDLMQAQKSYMSKMEKGMKLLRRGRFIAS